MARSAAAATEQKTLETNSAVCEELEWIGVPIV